MKRFDIRICGKVPIMIEAKLPVAISPETLIEKEKRLIGELIHTILSMVPGGCAFIIPSLGLSREQQRVLRMQIGSIYGNYDWEHLTDKIDRKLFTIQELRIIPLICNGLTAKQIHEETGIKYHTVRDLFKSLYIKAKCNKRVEFIAFVRNYLVE